MLVNVFRSIFIQAQIPNGIKLFLSILLSTLAFTTKTIESMGILFSFNLIMIFIFQAPILAILKESRFFIFQSIIILLLYIIKFGFIEGIVSGSLISIRFILFLLPGIILTNCMTPSQTAKCLSYILPHHIAFVLSVCLHFTHILIGEIRDIYEAQLMRGAKISPEELLNPFNWKDVINCLLIPTIVYAFTLAKQISLAAKAREFNIYAKRTYWNGSENF